MKSPFALPSKHSSWWRSLEDVLKRCFVFVFRRRLQEVFKTAWSRRIYSSLSYIFGRHFAQYQYIRLGYNVFKTSSRRLAKTSTKRLQDALLKSNIFVLVVASSRRLQKVFKTSSRRFARHLQEVFKTSSPANISCFPQRLEDVFSVTVLHLPWRLQDVFKTYLQDVFKTSSRHLREDVLQLRHKDVFNTLWRRLVRQINATLKMCSVRLHHDECLLGFCKDVFKTHHQVKLFLKRFWDGYLQKDLPRSDCW